jgi:nucleoside-diphosphate-sugar epimerase
MQSESNNKVFVAGAGGVIGRVLCRLLVEDGWHVTGTTRSASKAEILRTIGVEPVIVDVFDEKMLRGAVTQALPDIVIHQLTDLPPGLDPAQMAEGRVRNARIRDIGTRNLIAAAVECGVRRMVVQSIAFAYADGEKPYREDAPLKIEYIVNFEQQVRNAPLTGIILRYGQFYGPGTGFDAPPIGVPVHVEAAADAARRAVTRGHAGIYNIAENDGTVSSQKAVDELGWNPAFRIGQQATQQRGQSNA